WMTVRSTNDLKPAISSFLMCIGGVPRGAWGSGIDSAAGQTARCVWCHIVSRSVVTGTGHLYAPEQTLTSPRCAVCRFLLTGFPGPPQSLRRPSAGDHKSNPEQGVPRAPAAHTLSDRPREAKGRCRDFWTRAR